MFSVDTDECDIGTNSCEQNCQNTVGSYTCSCRPGYSLNANGKTCDSKLNKVGVACLLLGYYVGVACPYCVCVACLYCVGVACLYCVGVACLYCVGMACLYCVSVAYPYCVGVACLYCVGVACL